MSMCDKELKNTSLTNEYEDRSNHVPVRNAYTAVKRSKQILRPGKLNLKPIRLIDLKQQIIEAENEPLTRVPATEDDIENVNECEQTPSKSYINKIQTPSSSYTNKLAIIYESKEQNENAQKNNNMSNNYEDLDLSWLNTPNKATSVTTDNKLKNQRNQNNLKCRKALKNSPIATRLNHLSNKENIESKDEIPVCISKENQHFKDITINNKTYIIVSQIGKGGSSYVYFCLDALTNSERAIKKVNLDCDGNAVGYVNEVMLLNKLQGCDRIIKMFDYEIVESEKQLLVVLEKGGPDLSKILKDQNTIKPIPKYLILFYWMEMLYAVKQIHEHGIIHADLKPANFLMASGHLKLIDFGIASCLQNDMTSVVRNIPIGSFNYISPEALTNQPSKNINSPSFGKQKYKVNHKSDVWSLGCILYQLVYRKTPFQHIDHMWAKLSMIMNPEHKIEYPNVNVTYTKFVNTIRKCLQFDLTARPSVSELIEEYELY